MTRAALVGRVGGLAVALGVGAAIGTAVAAPAWASPKDSQASSSASADAKPGQVRAHASAARAAHADAAAAAGSGVAVSSRNTPKVSGANALAAAKIVPAQPISPPSPAPVQIAVTASAAARDVEQRASSRAAATSATSAAVTANHNTQGFSFLNKFVIFKNIPFSFPRTPAFFVKNVTGSAMFTDSSIYDLHSVDQYDWNKLTGISFNFFHPDQNALMVGWRYNVADNDFEIAPYYNVDFARILPNENPNDPNNEVIKVPIGQSFNFAVDYSGITLTYGNQTVFKPIPADLPTNQLTAFRIQPWFGGTSLPPNRLSLYLKTNCWWNSI
jgi:hypothetical protein